MAATKEIESSAQDDTSVSPSKKRKSALSEIEVDLELPEPPSKKARRALKKGKPLPTPSSSSKDKKRRGDNGGGNDDDDAEDADLPNQLKQKGGGGGDSKKAARSQHGVWVGNLPFTLTRAELFKWLVGSSGGAIAEDAITRVNLPLKKLDKHSARHASNAATKAKDVDGQPVTKENKGFAYVDFATYEACVAAIALSETELAGRRLLIKDSKSFEGRPTTTTVMTATAATITSTTTDANGENNKNNGTGKAAPPAAPANTNRKIYVGNLPFETDEETLRAHFDKCGVIEWVKVATFEDSAKCKGYGWVKFAEPSSAEAAVRGFAKIKEEVETEADFVDDDDEDEEEKEEAEAEDVEVEDEEDSDSDETSSSSSSDDDDDDDGKTKRTKKTEEEEKKKTAAVPLSTTKSPKKKPARPPPVAEKKFKMRKWWVNRLRGRNLTIQLAEDDQTRYKKRYGRDAASKAKKGQGQDGAAKHRKKEDGPGKAEEKKQASSSGGGGTALSYHSDLNVARLTGAVVAPQGKKVTFD